MNLLADFYNIVPLYSCIVFTNAANFNAPIELWDVSKVTDMLQSAWYDIETVVSRCTRVSYVLPILYTDFLMNALLLLHNKPTIKRSQCLVVLHNLILRLGSGMWVEWLGWWKVSIPGAFVYD